MSHATPHLHAARSPPPGARRYENGHLEKHVPPSRVQPMSTGHLKTDYVVGERVRANWQSCGTWCLGRICAVNQVEGTFNVQYDDGEVELHVAAHSLQPAEDAETKALDPEPLPFHCTLMSKAHAANASGEGSSGLPPPRPARSLLDSTAPL